MVHCLSRRLSTEREFATLEGRGSGRGVAKTGSPRGSPSRNCAGPFGVRCILFLLGLAIGSHAAAVAQVGPEKSAAQLKPAAGLEATLWASEPLLVNPTNIDIDSRGRVWVAEGLNYRLTRAGNRKFSRIEEADRIKILADTDGDGKADKVTVFADRIFPVPMGIAVEERYGIDGKYQGCRVFVGNSPDLLVLEDTDGDDKADKRYPLLTGFGGIDSDHGVHGMVLGLDGKLYFTHGDGCCSVQHNHSERQQNFDVIDKSGRHVWTDQLANTLRVKRDGTEFEIICDRQRNNYETCLTSFGHIFTSDNDDDGNRGCRVIWAMDGGHYGYRTPGSPRHWGEEVPGNVPKVVGTGNGSPCGIMVYEGELLPVEYRGAVLEVDAGTRQVNAFPLTRKGAAFQTEYKVFLQGDDPWFRPVDASASPDGSVFVADWYDAGVGGHAFSDQTTGRIYRVAPKGHKSEKVKVDFATVDGLMAALESPNLATQDVARRLLIARVKTAHDNDATQAIGRLVSGLPKLGEPPNAPRDPIYRARGMWVSYGIYLATQRERGQPVPVPWHDRDPMIREQAVRMIGRDCRENGRVQYQKPGAKRPPAALEHLDELLPRANDRDAGVRRELILAFRNLPTDKVGDALRTLTASWDGQDRWYLEALGLALEKRESSFIAQLFDGSLFGKLDLERSGSDGGVALPPYFPVDRNEAYIVAGTPDGRATALSKYLGLAWRLHRREVVPLLKRFAPHLHAVELQQAMNDILERMTEPETAALLAELVSHTQDSFQKEQWFALLARRLAKDWKPAAAESSVQHLIEQALATAQTRVQGIAMAVATGDRRYRATLESLARDAKLSEEGRAAAVEALGSFSNGADPLFDQLLASVKGKPMSTPAADAAVRAIARASDPADRLAGILAASGYPLGLRREALKCLVDKRGGGARVIALLREKKLPDYLKSQAAALLYTARDPRIRHEAAALVPPPKTANGRALPPIGELLRREGDAERGREVFFRPTANACSSCHRVQGRGQWVGPDLSTIGVKYGRDELIHSILSPSASIGLAYRSVVVALASGRTVTGLPVEDTPARLVLKTAQGERVVIEPSAIDERVTSDVSLMPEGLAETMTDQELVDLLAFLGKLRQPVSIVGQISAIGPISEPAGAPSFDTSTSLDLHAAVPDGRGHEVSWRRVTANAEGLVDLSAQTGGDAKQAAYAVVVVDSPVRQGARLVLDTPADVSAWMGGKPVPLSSGNSSQAVPRSAQVDLPQGASTLLIRIALGDKEPQRQAVLVTTFVSDKPVAFGEAKRN
jgi:putative membrane-bound dehydrogenase-like protein